MEQSLVKSQNTLTVLALTDSTGYGKLKGTTEDTECVCDWEQRIFHIISPGAALSFEGGLSKSGKKRLSLARALAEAQSKNEILRETLHQNLQTDVIFIQAKESCIAKQKYVQMEGYRQDMDLNETKSTIVSLKSQVFSNRILEFVGVGMCFYVFVLCFVFWWDCFCILLVFFLIVAVAAAVVVAAVVVVVVLQY